MTDQISNEEETVLIKTIVGHKYRVQCIELVNTEVWSGSSDATIMIHDAVSGEYLLTLQVPGKNGLEDVVNCLLFVRGYVWAGTSDGVIHIFNGQTGALVTQLLGHTGAVTMLSSSGGCVWSSSGDKSIRGWDPDTGQLVRLLTGHSQWARCVLSCDDRVWSGADDAVIRVWQAETGRLEHELHGHRGAVHCLLRVGQHVWSGGADKTIRVWSAQAGRALKQLHGHSGWVNCLLLREPFVWSGSVDRTIRLWNAYSGSCYRVFQGHQGWVCCLVGVGLDRVWSGSGDKSLRVWNDLGALHFDTDEITNSIPSSQRILRTKPISLPSLATPVNTMQSTNSIQSHPFAQMSRQPLPPANARNLHTTAASATSQQHQNGSLYQTPFRQHSKHDSSIEDDDYEDEDFDDDEQSWLRKKQSTKKHRRKQKQQPITATARRRRQQRLAAEHCSETEEEEEEEKEHDDVSAAVVELKHELIAIKSALAAKQTVDDENNNKYNNIDNDNNNNNDNNNDDDNNSDTDDNDKNDDKNNETDENNIDNLNDEQPVKQVENETNSNQSSNSLQTQSSSNEQQLNRIEEMLKSLAAREAAVVQREQALDALKSSDSDQNDSNNNNNDDDNQSNQFDTIDDNDKTISNEDEELKRLRQRLLLLQTEANELDVLEQQRRNESRRIEQLEQQLKQRDETVNILQHRLDSLQKSIQDQPQEFERQMNQFAQQLSQHYQQQQQQSNNYVSNHNNNNNDECIQCDQLQQELNEAKQEIISLERRLQTTEQRALDDAELAAQRIAYAEQLALESSSNGNDSSNKDKITIGTLRAQLHRKELDLSSAKVRAEKAEQRSLLLSEQLSLLERESAGVEAAHNALSDAFEEAVNELKSLELAVERADAQAVHATQMQAQLTALKRVARAADDNRSVRRRMPIVVANTPIPKKYQSSNHFSNSTTIQSPFSIKKERTQLMQMSSRLKELVQKASPVRLSFSQRESNNNAEHSSSTSSEPLNATLTLNVVDQQRVDRLAALRRRLQAVN